jgi:hypothetical protein
LLLAACLGPLIWHAVLPPLRISRYCEIGAYTAELPEFKNLWNGKLANYMFYMN